jgi:hypothetical protein
MLYAPTWSWLDMVEVLLVRLVLMSSIFVVPAALDLTQGKVPNVHPN